MTRPTSRRVSSGFYPEGNGTPYLYLLSPTLSSAQTRPTETASQDVDDSPLMGFKGGIRAAHASAGLRPRKTLTVSMFMSDPLVIWFAKTGSQYLLQN